ncbi:hypothetical protein N0V86_008518 [Didymella sp. IMI 355093]|nr:hypothetical protein N0V86_008518 [Didymella sp. IMI 355093]
MSQGLSYGFGDKVKSHSVFGLPEGAPIQAYKKGDGVRMKVPKILKDNRSVEKWTSFVVRAAPRWNTTILKWVYKLNDSYGAQYNGEEEFAEDKLVSSEKVDKAQKRTEALDRRRKEAAAREAVAKTKTIPLEDYPMGYPRLAAFQSSESSFSIYRSFDYLHGRVILNLQAELRDLEQELEILDDDDDTADDEEQQNRLKSRAVDLAQPVSEREILLSKIHAKLLQYDEMLMKAREMNGFQRPSNRDYMSLRHWCLRKSPLVAREVEFVERKEDLVTLRQGREWAGFDSLVESSIKRLPAGLAKVSEQCRLSSDSIDSILEIIHNA